MDDNEIFDLLHRLICFEISLHPNLNERDLCKFIFQASFGADHILENREKYFEELINEFNAIDSKANPNFPLVQSIDPQNRVYRLHLAPLKRTGSDAMSILHSLLKQEFKHGDKKYFIGLKKALKKFASEKFNRFDAGIIEDFCEGKSLLRHSDGYGFASYRVLNDIWDPVFLILKNIHKKGG
ncbi:hypothetical protein JW890_08825 [candidate division WOR-3 bacterium]|nr:hypothetical protein [candidate division WOR-3 bacterium]